MAAQREDFSSGALAKPDAPHPGRWRGWLRRRTDKDVLKNQGQMPGARGAAGSGPVQSSVRAVSRPMSPAAARSFSIARSWIWRTRSFETRSTLPVWLNEWRS